jgi:hypothetical protein
MQWISKQITRLKKERKTNSKKEKKKNYKIISNALIMISQSITPRITT